MAVRYGVVGTGYFGAPLARALAGLPGARVTAVHDPDPAVVAGLADQLGARVEHGVQELCRATDVDVVVVASPNHAHAAAALAAARAGKHVFCEKPIALDHADCVAMLDAARAADVVFMAGHVMHFMDGVRRVTTLVRDGAIGTPVFCRAVRTGWSEPSPGSWKSVHALSGGHLYHHIHELDLVQALLGPAQVATMVGGTVAHHEDAQDDLLLATLEMGGGRCASLLYGSALRWPEHHLLLQGTRGAIRIDLQDDVGVEVRTADGTERFPLHRDRAEDEDRARSYRASTGGGGVVHGSPVDPLPRWLHGIVEAETAALHRIVQGEAPTAELAPLVDGSAATSSIATADALTRSLREGRPVPLSEVTGQAPAPDGAHLHDARTGV